MRSRAEAGDWSASDVLIVGACPRAGAEAFYADLLLSFEVVVATDAGAEWCVSLGRDPDLAVGDFDSAEPGAKERLKAMSVPLAVASAQKDESDLDLAVVEARMRGARSVALTAAFEGRLDHTLASVGTLVSCADMYGRLEEPGVVGWALEAPDRGVLDLAASPGTLVSLFALGEARGVTLSGFEYPLQDACVEPLSSLGLSNVLTADRGEIRLVEGGLVVLCPLEPGAVRPRGRVGMPDYGAR